MTLRDSPSRPASGPPPTALCGLAILLALLLAAPGCSGCNWGGSSTTSKAKGKGEDLHLTLRPLPSHLTFDVCPLT